MFNLRYFHLEVALALSCLITACANDPSTPPAEAPISAATAAPTEATTEEAPGEAPTPLISTATNTADYCIEQGGQVVTRHPTYGIYDDSNEWLRLQGERQFCEFLEAEDGGEDGFRSRISLDLATLWSTEPTLATLAYYEPPPPPAPEPSVKLAFVYCTQLGGTANFGGQDNPAGGSFTPTGPDNAAGGGWVNEAEPVFVVMAVCVFPDGSMIDEWGLTYHANGAIRGADLSSL